MKQEIEGTSLFYDKEEKTLYRVNEKGEPEIVVTNCKYFKYPFPLGIKVFKYEVTPDGIKSLVGYIKRDGSNIDKISFGEEDIMPAGSVMERKAENGAVIEAIPI